MLFSDHHTEDVAISQPQHALLSGRILAAWAEPLDEPVVLAAAQHDVAWLDWELFPEFDEATRRPREFRSIGAAQHAPLWDRGVERALAAWGRRVALMISRHGSVIYERFRDRHRSDADADDRAAADYLARHAARQAAWTRALGLDQGAVRAETDLVAFADTLSLVLCGALPVPSELPVGDRMVEVARDPTHPHTLRLSPWPFAAASVPLSLEARPLPAGGLPDAEAMHRWLADPARVTMETFLVSP